MSCEATAPVFASVYKHEQEQESEYYLSVVCTHALNVGVERNQHIRLVMSCLICFPYDAREESYRGEE